jgi:nucleotide-binding universal stress UspA family protein
MGYAAPYTHVEDAGGAVLAGAADLGREVAPDVPCTQQLATGPASAVLVEASYDASSVVVGSRGLDRLSEFIVGSTSFAVATHAPVPVVVVRPPSAGDPGEQAGRVVVGVDGSDSAAEALGFAFEEAELRHVGLTAVRAWHWPFYEERLPLDSPACNEAEHAVDETERAALGESVGPWKERHPDVDVRERIFHARPVDALAFAGQGSELLVVGSRGRGGFRSLLLGSTSHGLLHHASGPVAVVRPFTAV